jgi:molecular chaperone GrpE
MDDPRTPPSDAPAPDAAGAESDPVAAATPPATDPTLASDAPAEEQPIPTDPDAPKPPLDLDPIAIYQAELARLGDELAAARDELRAERDRALRARADLDNLRRRHAAEADRARAAGQDAVIGSVLAVHDDLDRALAAAARSGDPTAIVPGVEAVLAGLLRTLETLGFRRTGAVGEPFDAALHEAIMVVPTPEGATPGTIQAVFEVGFRQGDRLVRPARVIVHQDA